MFTQEGTSKTFNSGGDFGFDKLSKANELSPEMTIKPSSQDEFETKLWNIGGSI